MVLSGLRIVIRLWLVKVNDRGQDLPVAAQMPQLHPQPWDALAEPTAGELVQLEEAVQ